MTRQELARMLCDDEGGAKEVNIAQMNEVLKVLSKRMKGLHGWQILKALLASWLVVILPACAMIPADFMTRLDQGVKDNGAGNYYLACQLGKDGRQIVGLRGDMECTADMLQLTGCHKQSIAVEGPR